MSSAPQNFGPPQPCVSAPDPVFATILVGPDKKRFIVHETVLVHRSEYFRAALTGGFSEAQDKTITIEDVCAETFELFVHWLYYQRLPSRWHLDDPELMKRFYPDDKPIDENLVNLYIFADAHQVPGLRRNVMEAVFAKIRGGGGKLMSMHAVENAFEHVQVKDPLCRLLVDQQCHYGVLNNPQRAEFTNLNYIKAVWERLVYLKNTLGMAAKKDPNICDYHEHRNEEERQAYWNKVGGTQQRRDFIERDGTQKPNRHNDGRPIDRTFAKKEHLSEVESVRNQPLRQREGKKMP